MSQVHDARELASVDLPEGWAEASVGQLVAISSGKYIKRSAYEQVPSNDKPYPVAGAGGPIGWTDTANSRGPVMTLGRVGAAGALNWYESDAWVTDNALVVRPPVSDLYPWLRYFFQIVRWRDIHTGSSQPLITQTLVKNLALEIPPLAEQKRIVAKLEELLGRANAARERLGKVPAILKRFRQSVLAAACFGELTEDWREGNPAESFLRSPLSDRPDCWQELDLPSSWTWGYLRDVANCRLGKMLDKNKNTGALAQYLRNINVRWFSFNLDDLLEIRIEPSEREKFSICNGDVLVCEGGEPGRAAVWRGGKNDFVFQKALHRIRLESDIDPDWFVYNLCHDATIHQLDTLFTGSTIKHLTGKAFAKYPLLVPPLPEQREIVRRVEALFKLADEIEQSVAAATKRAEKLTQAILAKAFRGELVPTEVELARKAGRSYEPASELLARVQTQLKNQSKAKHKRKGSGRGKGFSR